MRRRQERSATVTRTLQGQERAPILIRATTSKTNVLTVTEWAGATNRAASTTTETILPMFRVGKSSSLSMLENVTLTTASLEPIVREASRTRRVNTISTVLHNTSATASLSQPQEQEAAFGSVGRKLALKTALGVTIPLTILLVLAILWYNRFRDRSLGRCWSVEIEKPAASPSKASCEERAELSQPLAELPQLLAELPEARPELPELKVELSASVVEYTHGT